MKMRDFILGYSLGKSGSGGGGGGGLPTPTASDVGKTMMVQAVEAEGDVIVPEQTVAWDAEREFFAPVLNVDTDKFAEGAKVKLTINGESIVGTVTDGWIANVEDTMGFGNDEGDWVAYYLPDGDPVESITIKVVTIAETYQWTPTMVILTSKADNATGKLDITWQEVYDALSAGVPVFVYNVENEASIQGWYINNTRFYNNQYWIGYKQTASSIIWPWFAPTKDDLLLADDW